MVAALPVPRCATSLLKAKAWSSGKRAPRLAAQRSGTVGRFGVCRATEREEDGVLPVNALPVQRNSTSEVPGWVTQLPLKRIAAWAFVGFLGHQLKDFFGIAMGAFIISAIGNSFADSEEALSLLNGLPEVARRRILVLLYFFTILSLLTLFGAITIPDIVHEGIDFVKRLQNENLWTVVLEKMRSGMGDNIMDQFENFVLLLSTDNIMQSPDAVTQQVWSPERMAHLGSALQKLLRRYTEAAVTFTTGLLSFVTRFVLQMAVSLVLSFFLVWDAPRIRRGIQSLENSRLTDVYREVAPSFQVFSSLFGKALQAQALISIVNTGLTLTGLWILRIPNIGFMSLFVFICGFIPIAGVFISTLPMAFVALTEYGFSALAAVLVMVTAIHFVEAYGLNPLIYSAHLKLHPLLVLSVLVIAEHLVGVWGLLLAVPATVFALDYVIKYASDQEGPSYRGTSADRYPDSSVPEIVAKELDAVLPAKPPNSTL